jgi:hypothetical protein
MTSADQMPSNAFPERVKSHWQPVMDAMTVEKRLQTELTTLEAEIATRFKWAKFEESLRL